MPARSETVPIRCSSRPPSEATLEHFRLEPAQMLPGWSEQLGTAVCALEVQLDVVLPGDRDAAVHLDGLGGHLRKRLACRKPGQCRRCRGRLGDGVVDESARGL